MLRPPDKAAKELRVLANDKEYSNPEEFKKDLRNMRNWRLSRIVVLILLFLFTLSTLWVTGQMRASSEEYKRRLEVTYTQSTRLDGAEEITLPEGATEVVGDQDTIPIDDQAKLKESFEGMIKKSNQFYWFITILFPVLAGIFLSYSSFIFLNKRLFFKTICLYKKFVKRWEKSFGELNASVKGKAIFKRLLQIIGTDHFVKHQSQLFYLIYLHGYQRGVVSPGKEQDEYQRAKLFLNRLMSTRSTASIHKANMKVDSIVPIEAGK